MEGFRKVVKKRRVFLMIVTGLILLLNRVMYFLGSQYSKGNARIDNAIDFQVGLMIGLGFLVILGVYKYSRALKDCNSLKQLYISEHDERNAMIKQKMAKSVLVTGLILIIIAISVSIYFEPIVAMTLIVSLYVMVIITLIFKVYYHHKY